MVAASKGPLLPLSCCAPPRPAPPGVAAVRPGVMHPAVAPVTEMNPVVSLPGTALPAAGPPAGTMSHLGVAAIPGVATLAHRPLPPQHQPMASPHIHPLLRRPLLARLRLPGRLQAYAGVRNHARDEGLGPGGAAGPPRTAMTTAGYSCCTLQCRLHTRQRSSLLLFPSMHPKCTRQTHLGATNTTPKCHVRRTHPVPYL